ncbi:MAG: hypothetical protein E3J56_10785 [Candidatus Aminicenantes bacterium]|nr:MAG: hypothetical protein E3J56_10785 [Candidatus Aminicenantes bacterium]
MSKTFLWNRFADQPHNVAPKKERFWNHFKYAATYISLFASNLRYASPVLALYRQYRKKMYKEQVRIGAPFGVSVSPAGERSEEVVEYLEEMGIRHCLVRIPSWEKEKLDIYERFFRLIREKDIEFIIALLQQRDDVLHPLRWQHFLEDVFSRFGSICSFFETGHAWNRTKWGIWNYMEYLNMVHTSMPLAQKYGVKLVGPAVIDFEFHLYPPVLEKVLFDKISSLLYVDRMGAPENTQFGWDTSRKVALLKAVIDGCSRKNHDLWITEVNWALKGTGKYSPASGKINVTEKEQADYLVRYFILCLASGFVERIYWWQLVAPGYGLVDSRRKEWRRRPSFFAMKTMVSHLEGSIFLEKIPHPQAEIFSFCKGEKHFFACWINGTSYEHVFSRRVVRVIDWDGQELSVRDNTVKIDGSPKYVYF